MKTYAYIRVSTKKQSYERQHQNIIREYPDETICYMEEKESGKNNERPVFQKLLKKLQPGDKVVFDSVSRMSRDAEEGSRIYFDLVDKGVSLYFVNEPYINSEVYLSNCKDKVELTGSDEDEIFKGINAYFRKLAVRQIRIAFDQAEKEGRDISQRVSDGMNASGAGDKIREARTGKTFETKKAREMKEKIRKISKDFDGNMNDIECMDTLKIARNTFYRYKKQLKEGEEA